MSNSGLNESEKQNIYKTARSRNTYNDIWQSVGKCAFCDLKEKYIFFEENGVVMSISLYAYKDGHFMIIPRRHVTATRDLTDLEWQTIRKFTYIAQKLIKNVLGIKGMQVVQKNGAAAQSTVEHIHFHCIPFDDPKLCTWNYVELKRTPLENVAIYKNARKKIIEYDAKFTKKYSNNYALTVVCDALIVNNKSEILLQERADQHKLIPDLLTLPGGRVDDFDSSFETELAREIQEEIGYTAKPSDFELLNSQISSIKRRRKSTHLNVTYATADKFVWNTYTLAKFNEDAKLTPGDDCKSLHWVLLKKIANHAHINDEIKKLISMLVIRNEKL